MTIVALQRMEASALNSYAARPADLAIFRVIYATFVLASTVPVAPWLSLAPRAFFYPPLGIAALFTSLPPASVLLGLNFLLALFAAMLLVGWKTRVASFGTGIVLVLLESWCYSLGKIAHPILLVVTPLLLGFSGWGLVFSIDSIRNSQSPQEMNATQDQNPTWPLALFALLIGFAMFASGWAKASSGWLDPNRPCTFGHMSHNHLSMDRDTWLARQLIGFRSLWFWKMADYSAVALELLFLPAIFHRRSFCLIAGIATLFHLGVLLIFDIPFPANVLAYGAFVRYSELPWFRKLTFENPPSRKKATLIFLAAVTLGCVATCGGKSLAESLQIPLAGMVIWAGPLVAAACLFRSRTGKASGTRS